MHEFPPFRLDPINQCLWRAEERILLTPKAFSVLRYLVDHAGRLVSQDELLDALWPDTFVQPEVLKTHILDVRNALGDSAKNPRYIETLPRRGYRFMAEVSQQAAVEGVVRRSPAKLAGRDEDLAKLKGFLERASAGERQIVFVAGEIGVGKTTLIDAFEKQHAVIPGVRILRGQCVEGYGIQEPYYPVLEAIGHLLRSKEGPKLVQMLAIQAPTLLAQFPALLKAEHREMLQRELLGATKERMLREICETLESVSANKTLVLVLEDTHWVDTSTVDLIDVLASRRTRSQLMLLVTYRPVHVALAQHPIKSVKQRLIVHQLGHEMTVASLNEAQVEEVLTALGPAGPLPHGLTQLIYRHSEGNPLFLAAALDHLRMRDLLRLENEEWKLRVRLAEIDLEVPETLRQMLELHISRRLSEEEQRALEAASVSGVSFLIDVSAAAAELEPERIEDFCEILAQRGQLVRSAGLREMADGTVTHEYEFVHAFYREVFYHRIAAGRRARLHKRTGERLEILFATRCAEVATKLALHFEEGFEWTRAIQYLQLVAENEGRRFAYKEAVPVLEHALELAAKLPEPQRAGLEKTVLDKLGGFYFAAEDIDRAVKTFESAARRAALQHDARAEIDVLQQLVFPLARVSSEQCLRAVRRLLELSEEEKDPIVKARARMTALFWRIVAGGWSTNDAGSHRATLAEFGHAMPGWILAIHMMERAYIEFVSSEFQEGLRDVETSLPTVIASGSISHRAAQLVHVWLLLLSGKWGDGLRALGHLINMAQKNGIHSRELLLRTYQAWFHFYAQDFSGALKICEEILPGLAGPAVESFRRNALIAAGSAACALGKFEQAGEHLDHVSRLMDQNTILLDWYWRVWLHSARTDLAIKSGRLTQAADEARRFLELSMNTAERTLQALAWECNVRIALLENNHNRAREYMTKALSALEGYDLPLAAGKVHSTAIKVFPERAEHHRQEAEKVFLRLADSLAGFEMLRETFLNSLASTGTITKGRPSGAA